MTTKPNNEAQYRYTYPLLGYEDVAVDLDLLHRVANQVRKNEALEKLEQSNPLEKLALKLLYADIEYHNGGYIKNLIDAFMNLKVHGTELWVTVYSVANSELGIPVTRQYEVLFERCIIIPGKERSMNFRFCPPEDEMITLAMLYRYISGSVELADMEKTRQFDTEYLSESEIAEWKTVGQAAKSWLLPEEWKRLAG